MYVRLELNTNDIQKIEEEIVFLEKNNEKIPEEINESIMSIKKAMKDIFIQRDYTVDSLIFSETHY